MGAFSTITAPLSFCRTPCFSMLFTPRNERDNEKLIAYCHRISLFSRDKVAKILQRKSNFVLILGLEK